MENWKILLRPQPPAPHRARATLHSHKHPPLPPPPHHPRPPPRVPTAPWHVTRSGGNRTDDLTAVARALAVDSRQSLLMAPPPPPQHLLHWRMLSLSINHNHHNHHNQHHHHHNHHYHHKHKHTHHQTVLSRLCPTTSPVCARARPHGSDATLGTSKSWRLECLTYSSHLPWPTRWASCRMEALLQAASRQTSGPHHRPLGHKLHLTVPAGCLWANSTSLRV